MICSNVSWALGQGLNSPLAGRLMSARGAGEVPMINMLLGVLLVIFLGVLFFVVPTAAALGVGWLCVRIGERLLSRMTSPVTDNRILYWPVAVAIVCPLLFVLLLQLYQLFWLPVISEYLFSIIGLGLAAIWIGSFGVAGKLMIQWAAARQWRTVLSTLILPLTFLLVLSSSPFVIPLLWKETDTAAQYAHFFMAYHSYLARVAKEPATEPRFVVWMHDYSNRGLLYDETDEVASGHPSEAWKKKAELDGIVGSSQRHIIGHFYFVRFDQPQDDDVWRDLIRGYDLYKSGRIAPGH